MALGKIPQIPCIYEGKNRDVPSRKRHFFSLNGARSVLQLGDMTIAQTEIAAIGLRSKSIQKLHGDRNPIPADCVSIAK
ncbi:hypothetical protein [Oxynema aestuarii]|jgi:hypothetical protein|uniref:Uncharacterized protein n=1 Tax=Oxynema aestuarii AP17 TaxID=2064643 RepID=A0A6H1TX41_9CYAN|nr:hypothetical protein [Oxynema aestuarii]QIZ70323.1 hypothetical protein HCG48_06815 [Oxynema aestuarii AP17]